MIKYFGVLFLIFIISCNQFGSGYPKSVSLSESYKPIKHCYSKEISDLNNLPMKTRKFLKSHLIRKLGTSYFNNLKVSNAEILSDTILEKSESLNDLFGESQGTKNCIDNYDYPVYSITYSFNLKELGVEKIGLNIILDRNNKIIKDIEHEKVEFENIQFPIDSVLAELERRNISPENLKIHLGFENKSKTFSWNTYSIIREGSIAGPSCFPEYQYHFKMNSKTGRITKIKSQNKGFFN